MRQLLDTKVARNGMQFAGSDAFDSIEFSEIRFLGPGLCFLLTKVCQLLNIDAVGNKLQFLWISSTFQLILLVDTSDRNNSICRIITELLHEEKHVEPPLLEEAHTSLINAMT